MLRKLFHKKNMWKYFTKKSEKKERKILRKESSKKIKDFSYFNSPKCKKDLFVTKKICSRFSFEKEKIKIKKKMLLFPSFFILLLFSFFYLSFFCFASFVLFFLLFLPFLHVSSSGNMFSCTRGKNNFLNWVFRWNWRWKWNWFCPHNCVEKFGFLSWGKLKFINKGRRIRLLYVIPVQPTLTRLA